jgi:hypothetical protein
MRSVTRKDQSDGKGANRGGRSAPRLMDLALALLRNGGERVIIRFGSGNWVVFASHLKSAHGGLIESRKE